VNRNATALLVLLCALSATSALGQQQKRGLTKEELVSCTPEFERLRKSRLQLAPERIAKLKKEPQRYASIIQQEEAELQNMQSQPPVDDYWNLNGGYGRRVASEPLSFAQTNLARSKKNLAIYKSGDQKKIHDVIGVVPSPAGLEHYIAMEETDICVLQLRIAFFRTGKVSATK
jgi:hypothetical protein